MESVETGHYLEAVAVLDSLLGDRLTSRYSYVRREDSSELPAVGQLCDRLLNGYKTKENPHLENDPRFRAIIEEIQKWSATRNQAMHQTAKILANSSAHVRFIEILEEHRQTALDGVSLLRRLDELDTQVRFEAGKRPGTWPDAFFPERSSTRRSDIAWLNRMPAASTTSQV
ncbi:hypothetical protein [Nocardia huaxiensis]|uniref:Uncharacterized protein n=1 Tax=Nocardia huaxiensis TaxID=2755382 RepID=A0A7D6ZHQ9_9NOCA|nr:hypothetical protein [Nocardia huaxiensis]QLY31239.1 hypothetical protein H0264_02370 [Nocardia huaxiensis]UFS94777.1 hypothetical protein LPY97_29195 [Nocardia huaxiensis]